MQVDEKTVRRIARLARIKITDEEAKSLEGELSGILNWVEQLDEIDTSNVEPMTRVVAQKLKKREDRVTDGEIAADTIKNAPMVDDHYFVAPKVVEQQRKRRASVMSKIFALLAVALIATGILVLAVPRVQEGGPGARSLSPQAASEMPAYLLRAREV